MALGRHLGRLAAMLNPLDQSAVQQIRKATGGGKFAQAMAIARAGVKQIATGGYFQGRTMVYDPRRVAGPSFGGGRDGFRSMALGGGGGNPIARKNFARGIGQTRQAIGLGIGALAGLNLFAPNSGLTSAANIGALGIGAYAIGQGPIAEKFGQKGANWMYAGLGAGAIGHLTGVI